MKVMTKTITEEDQWQLLDVDGMAPQDAVAALLDHAADLPASDLFIYTEDDGCRVMVRHLGIVRPLAEISLDAGRRFTAYLKATAGMDLAERRRPADGRWILERPGAPAVDIRINTIPTMYGEDLALRLLLEDSERHSLDSLGLNRFEKQHLFSMISSPSGMILVTGPTGSGKSTTLYACIEYLNNGQRKINTIEDPIEFAIRGIRQSQVNPRIDLNFTELLRSVLRQAPDIIMIGEIRDAETAETAVRAANSGHMVFSTLHAPVAAAAVQSMRSLGVNHHFLSTSLLGVLSQRLLRTLCPKCKTSFDLSQAPHTFDEIRHLLGPNDGKVMHMPGKCEACFYSGYANRVGLFEIMPVSFELRRLISDSAPIREIREKAKQEGMLEFRQAALLKVAEGLTSTEEVFRVVPTEYLLLDDE